MTARDWLHLARDLARYNRGVYAARAAYAERVAEIDTPGRRCICGNRIHEPHKQTCAECRAIKPRLCRDCTTEVGRHKTLCEPCRRAAATRSTREWRRRKRATTLNGETA